VATPEYRDPSQLENYLRIVAFPLDLFRISFYSVIEFLHHSTTTNLILLLELTRGQYLTLRVLQPCWGVIISLVAGVVREAATQIGTAKKLPSATLATF
jgi:hypothetical protein